jgi:cell fate regulator YaaT (PSP1 superfamily)
VAQVQLGWIRKKERNRAVLPQIFEGKKRQTDTHGTPIILVGVPCLTRHLKKQGFLKNLPHLNKTEQKNAFFDPSKMSISCGLPMGPLRGSYGIRK